MIPELLALAIALLLALVGKTPEWLKQVALVGGIAFVIYVLILAVKWLIARA